VLAVDNAARSIPFRCRGSINECRLLNFKLFSRNFVVGSYLAVWSQIDFIFECALFVSVNNFGIAFKHETNLLVGLMLSERC